MGPLRIVDLPFPRAVTMRGERLPASYANFYIGNGFVIVPTFNDPNDRVALNTIAELLPDHSVVGIHAVDLVWGLGTLHCLTQQEPAAGASWCGLSLVVGRSVSSSACRHCTELPTNYQPRNYQHHARPSRRASATPATS